MSLELSRPSDFLSLVDPEKGLVDRKVYSDQQIYEIELERIFARAWNFMTHETMLIKPGDFFLTYIGEDRVIVVRDKDMGVQVLINSCRHRGNAVCRAEEGHATSFMCTYHGWTYDLKGNLVGVPGFKEVYHEDLKREEWGLIKAAKVDSYKGFIFATMDAEAPDLPEYLGETGRLAINELASRGDMAIAPGIEKWTIGCNWKFAVDNVWDYYHGGLTHASASMSGWQGRQGTVTSRPAPQPVSRFAATNTIVLGEYGHAMGGPSVTEEAMNTPADILVDNSWRQRPDVRETLGPVGQRAGGHGHIFPNLWLMQGFNQVSLRLPKGPMTTEIWWFTMVYKDMDPSMQAAMINRVSRHNGPAGMFEIDDGENWGQSTIGTRGKVSGRYPLNYAMNLGRGEIVKDETGPAHIDTCYNEHAQLWYYRSWSEWMAAESWPALRAHHSMPEGYV